MSALYRRYRPQKFSDLIGQEHIQHALRNSLLADNINHAYLFSGPRGTGKTTSARILAMALNCTDLQDGEPCGECDSCEMIRKGASQDVQELDAASNSGVDAMRGLIDTVTLASMGRYKVIILDEVHMLTKQAEAALLKTLEEPPANVVFVFATTDPQKITDTIRSRTQWLEFGLIDATPLKAHLEWIAKDAELDVSDDMIRAALRQGAGSARDTLSALDRIVAVGGVDGSLQQMDKIVHAFTLGPIEAKTEIYREVDGALRSGIAPPILAENLTAYLHACMMCHLDEAVAEEMALGADYEIMKEQSQHIGLDRLTDIIQAVSEAILGLNHVVDPRVTLQVRLMQAAQQRSAVAAPLGEVPAMSVGSQETESMLERALERIDGLENQLRDLQSTAPERPERRTEQPSAVDDDGSESRPSRKSDPAINSEVETSAKAAANIGIKEIRSFWSATILEKLQSIARAIALQGDIVRYDSGVVDIEFPTGLDLRPLQDRVPQIEQMFGTLLGILSISVRLIDQEHQDGSPPVRKPIEASPEPSEPKGKAAEKEDSPPPRRRRSRGKTQDEAQPSVEDEFFEQLERSFLDSNLQRSSR